MVEKTVALPKTIVQKAPTQEIRCQSCNANAATSSKNGTMTTVAMPVRRSLVTACAQSGQRRLAISNVNPVS